MDLKQYVQDAIRTESLIDKVRINDYQAFQHALAAFVAASQILDFHKKNVFYGKPIDPSKLSKAVGTLHTASKGLHVGTEETHASSIDPRVFHALIGIMTEAGELGEIVQESLNDNKAVDGVHVAEELGDINWYQAIAIDAVNADFDNILNTNIAKLKKRYPNKFTSECAIDRNVIAERQLLEQQTKLGD